MTSCPAPLTYPHLPDTFTGNRVGVDSAGEPELRDGMLCCELWHPTSVRQKANSNHFFMLRASLRSNNSEKVKNHSSSSSSASGLASRYILSNKLSNCLSDMPDTSSATVRSMR